MCSTDNVRKAIRDREYRELLETTEEKQRKGTLAARENVAMQVYICLYFAVVFFFCKEKSNNSWFVYWWETANKGKINTIGQSSANYLVHSSNVAC